MKCIVCKKKLEEIGPNHPTNALNFQTQGHYGSSVFDPMDGTALLINVCDPCLTEALKEGTAVIHNKE